MSKKLRIDTATVSGPSPKFAPSAEGWATIQRALGRQFNEQDRSKICEIVNRFFEWRRFETAATPVKNVVSHIEAIEKAARSLNHALLGPTVCDGPDRKAFFGAETAIEKAWPGSGGVARGQLQPLISLGHQLVLACTQARKTVEAGGLEWEGQAWDQMIRRLAEFAHDHGVSTAVRKDASKQREVKARQSPLVNCVKAIQDQYPEAVPIRFSTGDSLATAINKLRLRLREHGINWPGER